MATCLSQIYHEHKRGIKVGYAKFETFPIWNLPLKHPVNIAYEAATADLNDINMIDPFHLDAYNETAVNYNRDVEIFPVLNTILTNISTELDYKSPTDMGVNMAGYCIYDDDAVCDAAKQEIIRRYYTALGKKRQGYFGDDEIMKIEILMKQVGISCEDRKVVNVASERAEKTGNPATAIELHDGTIVSGKTSPLLGASAAVLLNALKSLAGIPREHKLIPQTIIEPIQMLKTDFLGNHNPRLHTDEILVALAICASTDPIAKLALEQVKKLRDCEAHSTVILSQVDATTFRKLGVNLTCEPKYQTKKLYHGK